MPGCMEMPPSSEVRTLNEAVLSGGVVARWAVRTERGSGQGAGVVWWMCVMTWYGGAGGGGGDRGLVLCEM